MYKKIESNTLISSKDIKTETIFCTYGHDDKVEKSL